MFSNNGDNIRSPKHRTLLFKITIIHINQYLNIFKIFYFSKHCTIINLILYQWESRVRFFLYHISFGHSQRLQQLDVAVNSNKSWPQEILSRSKWLARYLLLSQMPIRNHSNNKELKESCI